MPAGLQEASKATPGLLVTGFGSLGPPLFLTSQLPCPLWPRPGPSPQAQQANEAFLGDEHSKQQLIMR